MKNKLNCDFEATCCYTSYILSQSGCHGYFRTICWMGCCIGFGQRHLHYKLGVFLLDKTLQILLFN